MVSGSRYVIIGGITEMHRLCADNWVMMEVSWFAT